VTASPLREPERVGQVLELFGFDISARAGAGGARLAGDQPTGRLKSVPGYLPTKDEARDGEGTDLLCEGPSLRRRAARTPSARCKRVLVIKGSKVQADSSMGVPATR
jgi:hypothetical protein